MGRPRDHTPLRPLQRTPGAATSGSLYQQTHKTTKLFGRWKAIVGEADDGDTEIEGNHLRMVQGLKKRLTR